MIIQKILIKVNIASCFWTFPKISYRFSQATELDRNWKDDKDRDFR